MGLDPRQYAIAGYVLVENDEEPGSLTPNGTLFTISVPTAEEGRSIGFWVTAQHNVRDQNRVWATIRTSAAAPQIWELSTHWFYPDDPSIDLAVHPMMGDPGLIDQMPRPWPIGITSTRVSAIPRHGEPMFYSGLHLPIPATWQTFTPIVRSGTLAGVMVPGITWGDRGEWGPTQVHLLDCQAVHGYSGSPVFMEAHYPGPSVHLPDAPPTLPGPWAQQLELSDFGLNSDAFGTIYSFHALAGIMVAVDGTGIGIVLPVGQLHALVESDDLQDFIASS